MRIAHVNLQGDGVAEFRHWAPARALIEAGHTVTYFQRDKRPDDLWKWAVQHAKKHDIIHVGYATHPGFVATLVAVRNFAKIPVVSDVDDDFLHVPDYNYAFMEYHEGTDSRRVIRMQCRVSDALAVTTNTLADVLRNDCKQVAVLPNCNDPSQWNHPRDPKRGNDMSVRMLYAGSMGHLGDLNVAQEAICAAMEKYDGTNGKPMLRLFFIGIVPDWAVKFMPSICDPHANRVFACQGAGIDTYRAMLKWLAPDIFIAPLVDNAFNRSKSDIKSYDAAMCGATLLCSDIPTYTDVPNDCCVKAGTTYQWSESIDALVEDAAMRKRLSKRLETWVLDTRDIRQHIAKWEALYAEVCARGPITDLSQIVRPPDAGQSVDSVKAGTPGS
jgi:glycosyltransferase involved in cell wall biosynthesis